jgi:sugar/nucleoside kinase (ribokinase family)
MQRGWHAVRETSKTEHDFCTLLDRRRVSGQECAMTATDDDRAGSVLVVGDANPDLVLCGDVVPQFGQAEQLLDSVSLVIGGSAGITAHGLARLRRPVAVVAAVGADVFGTTVTAALAAGGVDTSELVVHPDQPTGVTVVLSKGADRAILTMPGAIPALSADDVRAAVARAIPAGLRHVHICSFFLTPKLSADLPDLLAEIRHSGITTSLDTNDDPAGAWDGVTATLPHLDLLLPNRAEALALAGAIAEPTADLDRACRALAERGPTVVVKDGADGARAVAPDGTVAVGLGVPARIVDATGAGDSFNAAFLDAWLSELATIECLRRGVIAGARSVEAVGGTAAQPSLEQLLDDRRTP